MEKKIYEEPTVQKVEFDFKTRIAASITCSAPSLFEGDSSDCLNN